MAELGRIADDGDLLATAELVCHIKPKAHDAVCVIRRARLGKVAPGNALQLTEELTQLIDNYRLRHPATTWQQIRAALYNALDAMDAVEAGGDGQDSGQ